MIRPLHIIVMCLEIIRPLHYVCVCSSTIYSSLEMEERNRYALRDWQDVRDGKFVVAVSDGCLPIKVAWYAVVCRPQQSFETTVLSLAVPHCVMGMG